MATISGPPYTIPHRNRFFGLSIPDVAAGGGTGGTPTWTWGPGDVRSGDVAIAACVTRNASINTTVFGGGAGFQHLAGFDVATSEVHRYWWKQCKDEGTAWNFSVGGSGAGGFGAFRSKNAAFLGLGSFAYNTTHTSPAFTVTQRFGLVVMVYMNSAFLTTYPVYQQWNGSVLMREIYHVQQGADEYVSIFWGIYPRGSYSGMWRHGDGGYDSSATYVFDYDVGGR